MSTLFSLLIATDCHLGYEETNHIIGDDSFITFEEILLKAVEQNVDLILLGGDLFHHNNPSQKCMNKCMELLRLYTLGNKPVYFELLSNASEVFSNTISETTNYLDDNINVSIPVFSIHGNHDDPSGLGHFSALDTLSSAGLVNYFGKWTDLLDVTIKPILLRKGKTKIALYGLSHIKDDRLCRLFLENKVTFIRPEVDPESWFNIFVLHQNRVDRGPKRFISESYIPEFMDLIIWGHEHDCEIDPIKNMEKGFYVIQPGSSVPTSLSQGESLPKHVALLQVYKKKMKITPLKLCTVRPFVWRSEKLWEISLTSDSREEKSEEIKTHCMQIVEEMIKEAEELWTGHPKQPRIPLIRLRCEYSDETELFNIVKFGQLFQGRVANPNGEIVRLKRSVNRLTKKEKSEDLKRLNELYKENTEESEASNFISCVNHIVKDYFTNHEEAKMLILRVPDLAEAVEKFIEKEDVSAIDELVDNQFEKMIKDLKQQKVNSDESNMIDIFEQMRAEYEQNNIKEENDFEKKLNKTLEKKSKNTDQFKILSQKRNILDERDTYGEKNDQKSRNIIVSDSDPDEYENNAVTSDFDFKINNSNDVDDDDDIREFFISEKRGKNLNAITSNDHFSKASGRGKGRGRAKREPAPKTSSTRKIGAKQKEIQTLLQFSKSSNTILFDSDSD